MGSEEVVMVSAGPMVIESAWVAVCGVGEVLSVAFTVKLKVPVDGLPEMVPAALSVRPVGSVPVLRVQT